MGFERRRLLRIMSFALGSSMLLSRAELGVAAQTATPPKPSSPSEGAEVGHGLAGEAATEKVTGIGGLFFRAKDPAVLGRWYQEHLGIALTPANYNDPVWEQEAGPTVFSPFPQTSNYFGDTQRCGW